MLSFAHPVTLEPSLTMPLALFCSPGRLRAIHHRAPCAPALAIDSTPADHRRVRVYFSVLLQYFLSAQRAADSNGTAPRAMQDSVASRASTSDISSSASKYDVTSLRATGSLLDGIAAGTATAIATMVLAHAAHQLAMLPNAVRAPTPNQRHDPHPHPVSAPCRWTSSTASAA